jgi:hypothetical protein
LPASFGDFWGIVFSHFETSKFRLYWFRGGAEVIDDRNRVDDDVSYAALTATVAQSDDDITVYVLFDEASPSEAPFPDVAERSTPAKSGGASSARSSAQQTAFRSALLTRDGTTCVLCVDADGGVAEGGVEGAEVDAAHIVPRDSEAEVMLEAGLVSSWDPRNGILLCKRCHRAFDAGLWHVDDDGAAVVATAAKNDAEVGSYWRARDGRSLRRPAFAALERSFPDKSVWAVTVTKFEEARAERHRLAADFEYHCQQCGKPYKTLGGLEKHQGSPACVTAVQGGRRLMFSPDDT